MAMVVVIMATMEAELVLEANLLLPLLRYLRLRRLPLLRLRLRLHLLLHRNLLLLLLLLLHPHLDKVALLAAMAMVAAMVTGLALEVNL
jgi:hypothetical protein